MGDMVIEDAVDNAIDAMPKDFEIRKFLEGNREEVKMDLITEYNEEEHMRLVRRDAMEEGREEGREEGIRLFIEDKIEDGFTDEQVREKLRKKFMLSEDRIEECMKRYAGSMTVS